MNCSRGKNLFSRVTAGKCWDLGVGEGRGEEKGQCWWGIGGGGGVKGSMALQLSSEIFIRARGFRFPFASRPKNL